MNQQKVLELALEALSPDPYKSEWVVQQDISKAITAIKEALANEALEKMAENARELGLDYEPAQEPVAWMFQHNETGRMSYVSNDGLHNPTTFIEMNPRYALVCPLYTTPPQRTWVGLMRGVRVEGDTVVISIKGGNDAARELCGALIEEMNR